jgi:hypothetical protein
MLFFYQEQNNKKKITLQDQVNMIQITKKLLNRKAVIIFLNLKRNKFNQNMQKICLDQELIKLGNLLY